MYIFLVYEIGIFFGDMKDYVKHHFLHFLI